jgi:hypothetical protein
MKGENMKQADRTLFKAGTIADLSFSIWGANTRLRPEDLGLKRIPEKLMILGVKRLIAKKRLAKMNKIIRQARFYLSRRSYPFPLGSLRFIPFKNLSILNAKMNEFEKEFNEEVEKFKQEYDLAREEMLKEYDKGFEEILSQQEAWKNYQIQDYVLQNEKNRLLDKVKAKYPDIKQLESKFGFDFVLFEITPPNLDPLVAGEDQVKWEMANQIRQDYRAKINSKMDDFLSDAVGHLKGMILDMVSKMKLRVEKNKVSLHTVKSYYNFVDAFRDLNFMDINIDKAINGLIATLGEADSKKELNDVDFKAKLTEGLNEISELAEEVDVDHVLGRFHRKLRIEEIGDGNERWESKKEEADQQDALMAQ